MLSLPLMYSFIKFNIHCVSKKVSTFELSVTLSNLNRFSKFLHCWKAYEICYKTYSTISTSPQACYYATLGNKKVIFLQIFSRYGRKCKQIVIFLVFKIWSFSPYRLQITFCMSLFFYLFTNVVNFWHHNFVTADAIAVFATNNMVFGDEDKIFIKVCI